MFQMLLLLIMVDFFIISPTFLGYKLFLVMAAMLQQIMFNTQWSPGIITNNVLFNKGSTSPIIWKRYWKSRFSPGLSYMKTQVSWHCFAWTYPLHDMIFCIEKKKATYKLKHGHWVMGQLLELYGASFSALHFSRQLLKLKKENCTLWCIIHTTSVCWKHTVGKCSLPRT